MARYNTVIQQSSTTNATTIISPNEGEFTKFTGTSYTVTIPNPTLISGVTQSFYNAASGTITLSTPSGVFRGNGSSGTSTQTVGAGTSITLASDGTDYVIVSQNGGTANFSDLTVTGNVTTNGSNATISMQPTGTGTVTIYPATAGNINRMNIGATVRGTGAFSTLAANGAVNLDTGTNNQSITTTGAGTITVTSVTRVNIDNMNIGATTRGTGSFLTLTANDSVTFTKGTASTSTSTGTLVVTGGIGVSGSIYTGAASTIGGALTVSSGGLTVSAGGLTVSAGGASINGATGVSGALTVASGNSIRARYGSDDSYSGSLSWHVLQLGNNGDNHIVGGNTAGGGSLRFWVNATTGASSGTWTSSGTNALTLANNGNATFSGTITENSSIAYKENVNPIIDALDKILMLNGVTYDRTAGSDNKNEAGLIAEQVYEVLPNLVQLKDGKPDGVCYNRLTAYLIEAVKTLKAEIDSLRK